MTMSIVGEQEWWTDELDDGHRDHHLKILVQSDSGNDGPYNALNTPGLPAVGALWNFFGDNDSWAYCWPTRSVKALVNGEVNFFFTVDLLFSTREMEDKYQEITTPFARQAKVRGRTLHHQKELVKDIDGEPLTNQCPYELIRGKAAEFDRSEPGIFVELILPSNPLQNFYQWIDYVNDSPMWGFDARCIKLSDITWYRRGYMAAQSLYIVELEFDIHYYPNEKGNDGKTLGFDRQVLDEGFAVLSSAVGASMGNPAHWEAFRRIPDRERSRVIRGTDGRAWNGTGNPAYVTKKGYFQTNFFTAFPGLPADF